MDIETYKTWKTLAETLRKLKKEEAALRKQIVQEFKGADEYATGTFNVEIFGDEVQIVQRDTLKMDQAMLKVLWQDLTEAEKMCIEHAPKLLRKEYEALPDGSTMSMEIVTRALSSPTVKVIS